MAKSKRVGTENSSEITWGEIKRRAAKEADKIAQTISSKPQQFCQYVIGAFNTAAYYAVAICYSSKERHLDSAQFLSTYLRLVENLKRADKLLQISPNLLDKWPQVPNLMFEFINGSSALQVMYHFSRMVENAVTIARAFTLGVGRGENFFDGIVPSDDHVRAWLDAVIMELQTRTLSPIADWPGWKVRGQLKFIWRQFLAELPGGGVKEKAAQKERESNPVKDRFTFSPGQVCFDNKDLHLPTGLAIDVLRKLVESFGKTVGYRDLDDNSEAKNASEQLRDAKRKIKKALKANKTPCKIETKKGEGYIISPQMTHK
jgi:hypothetical protein